MLSELFCFYILRICIGFSIIDMRHAEGSNERASPLASSARLRFEPQLSVSRDLMELLLICFPVLYWTGFGFY